MKSFSVVFAAILLIVSALAAVKKRDVLRTDTMWDGKVTDVQSSNKTDVIFYIWYGPVECYGTPNEIWRYEQGCTKTNSGSVYRICLPGGVLNTSHFTTPACQGEPATTDLPWHLDSCNSWQWAQELVQCPHIL